VSRLQLSNYLGGYVQLGGAQWSTSGMSNGEEVGPVDHWSTMFVSVMDCVAGVWRVVTAASAIGAHKEVRLFVRTRRWGN
jgi:hypothetical protein